LLLDGGLATELEQRGHHLDHYLWSAKLLISDTQSIANVHRAYLQAGADCIISASYQASVPGYMAAGQTKRQAIQLIRQSAQLACRVRDEFWADRENHQAGRQSPLVAASIGPYGAALADGSEYRGDYRISADKLKAFHEPRWEVLAASEVDCLACETIPSVNEAHVLYRLIELTPEMPVWISFSCRDEKLISDGTPLSEAISVFSNCRNVFACGINCTPPRFIPSLIGEARRGIGRQEIIVYPNSGEYFNASNKSWYGSTNPSEFARAACTWLDLGARLIGGCCRTGPQHIKEIREKLLQRKKIK